MKSLIEYEYEKAYVKDKRAIRRARRTVKKLATLLFKKGLLPEDAQVKLLWKDGITPLMSVRVYGVKISIHLMSPIGVLVKFLLRNFINILEDIKKFPEGLLYKVEIEGYMSTDEMGKPLPVFEFSYDSVEKREQVGDIVFEWQFWGKKSLFFMSCDVLNAKTFRTLFENKNRVRQILDQVDEDERQWMDAVNRAKMVKTVTPRNRRPAPRYINIKLVFES